MSQISDNFPDKRSELVPVYCCAGELFLLVISKSVISWAAGAFPQSALLNLGATLRNFPVGSNLVGAVGFNSWSACAWLMVRGLLKTAPGAVVGQN